MNDKKNDRITETEKLKADHDRIKKELGSLRKENAALRRSLNHRETLVRALPVGVLMVQGEKIVAANAEILNCLGYDQEDVLNRGLREFVPHGSRSGSGDILGKSRPGATVSDVHQIELIGKHGRVTSWDAKVGRIRAKGNHAYLVVLTGSEERIQRENKIAESAKVSALRAMASGLSAALKSTARSLMGREDCRGQAPILDHDRKGMNIEGAAVNMEQIGKALDCLARDACEPFSGGPFDLRKVVKEALGAAGLRSREEGEDRALTIQTKTYLRSVSPVAGDAQEIRQVLVYVIKNAVEAMPGGGYLYLSTEENAGYAYIYVQDSGVGVPSQICERILDPFFTTKGKGRLGLGLSLARAILRRHGGELEISSKKDEGTMVTVRLPLAKREGRSAVGAPRKKTIKHARILIIEQAPMIGDLMLQALKSKGCGVEMAATATEALGQLRKKPFDMVIVGSDISDMKGENLARRIKKSKTTVPVALIADAEVFERKNLRPPIFADLVITKPIDMNHTLERITEVLNGPGKTGGKKPPNPPLPS